MKIVADNKIPFLRGVLEPFAKVEYFSGKDITADKVKDADALIVRTRTKCDAGLLEGSKVKFIATATIGFDHIDAAYCKSKNINWTNAPGCNSGSVMQYIASALMHLSDKYNFSFSEKTIGIIGVGNVGTKVAYMASVLGMQVLLNDPPRERKEGKSKFVSLDEIQAKADIISFHVPLNHTGIDKSFHLFNHDFLDKIKPGTIILNSSRGEVVSRDVLKNGLKSKKVQASVLDVWENEPDIDLELLDIIDIATPHIAGYSADGKANGTSMSVQAISKFFGLALNNWSVQNIPKTSNKKFTINCKELLTEEVLKKAIQSSYDILEDDKRLRKSTINFEEQRGNYPLRREFHAYTPELVDGTGDFEQKIKLLGFNNIIKPYKTI